jgi:hypothetical protein
MRGPLVSTYVYMCTAQVGWLWLVLLGSCLALAVWVGGGYHAETQRAPLRSGQTWASRRRRRVGLIDSAGVWWLRVCRYPERVQRALSHFSMGYSRHGDGRLHLVEQQLPRQFVDGFHRYRHRAAATATSGGEAEDEVGGAAAAASGRGGRGGLRSRRGSHDDRGGGGGAPTASAAVAAAAAAARAAHSPYNLRPHTAAAIG